MGVWDSADGRTYVVFFDFHLSGFFFEDVFDGVGRADDLCGAFLSLG